MFARIRLPLGDPVDRLFVPEAAVGTNQDRKILWLVGIDKIVTAREVTVGQKLGTWIAVEATDAARPLTTAERVVVRGLQRCREGKPVKPTTATEESLDVASLVPPVLRRDPPEVPAAPVPDSPSPAVPAPGEPPATAPASPSAAEPLPAPGEATR